MSALLDNITTVLGSAIQWVGTVTTSLFSSSGAMHDLLPYLALGLGIGILGLGVKYVRSFVQIS